MGCILICLFDMKNEIILFTNRRKSDLADLSEFGFAN